MGRSKKAILDGLSRAANVHIVTKSHQWSWPEDLFSAEVLLRLEIDCVFDVGANCGQYGQNLREIGYRGTILSFEPGLLAFRDLEFDPIGFYSVHPGVILDPHEFNCYLLRRDLAQV